MRQLNLELVGRQSRTRSLKKQLVPFGTNSVSSSPAGRVLGINTFSFGPTYS